MKKYDAIVAGAGSGGNIGALALQKGGKNTQHRLVLQARTL